MSPTITTTTTTSSSFTPRSSVCRAFSAQIAGLVGVKPRASASKRKHRSLPPTYSPRVTTPAAPHRRMSAASLRPALRRGSTDSSTSCSSAGSSSPSPAVKITFPIVSAKVDRKILLPENTSYNAGNPTMVQRNSCLRLLHRAHIFTPSSTRQRRTSRVFTDLAPPPEWDEVSLTIESESDDDFEADSEDEDVGLEVERKVRFVVPAPPPPAVEEDSWDDEPAWSDFMVR
ncbi:hypothetical protein C8R44DRAFT_889498 [Mycena epipterygia]|nr:hypothetical protein C8R44DRAFT_889498 [Mycena epipterygia]